MRHPFVSVLQGLLSFRADRSSYNPFTGTARTSSVTVQR
jgi:hypothetical protein